MTDEMTKADLRTVIELTRAIAKKDAALREAHNFGFWWWCGPANGAELDEAIKAEEASWAEFQTKAALAPAAQGGTGDNQDGPAEPVDNLLDRRVGDSSGSARIAVAAPPLAPAPSAGETVLEIVEHAIREKKRGLYSFAINYDRPGGPAIGFDGNTNEFYMALEELGLHHLETIRAALAAAPTTGETP